MELEKEKLLYQESLMNTAVEQAEYNLFVMLKPKLTKDGNQWCVLYGDNIQEGIAGFGDSPYKAILDFNQKWLEG